MVTLYYQWCVNSQIYTDFVQVFTLNLCSTSWSRSYRPCFPFAKGKRLKYSFNWNSTCLRTSVDSLAITESLLFRPAWPHESWEFWKIETACFFFVTLWLRFDNWHGDKDRALSWVVSLLAVVKQDKSSLCSSLSQLHCSALARLGLFARPTKTAMLRAGHKFIFFCHSL